MIEAILLLSMVVYHESRGEPVECQKIVAETVINRSINRSESVIDVITDPYQFVYKGVINEPIAFATSYEVASDVYNSSLSSNFTHFHSGQKPYWAEGQRAEKCGKLYFYNLNEPTESTIKYKNIYKIYKDNLGR